MDCQNESTHSTVVLPDLLDKVIERGITNVRRKLVAGYRNKKNSRPNAKTSDPGAVLSDTLDATAASSVLDVAQRGQAWKEMITKSFVSGISSITTIKFDGTFTVKDGIAEGMRDMPNKPGVYVVFDKENQPVYVGDSTKLGKRWVAGHMNDYRRGKRMGKPYKLDGVLEDGCTVRWIVMGSKEAAAALEAHLIREHKPAINSREELLTEQGTRSNQEGKKMKDSSGSTAKLARGAAKEGLANMSFAILEQLADAICFALKDELADICFGKGKSTLAVRVERFLRKVFEAVKGLVTSVAKLLAGLIEFVVNALSKAIAEIYALVRNLCDLAKGAWDLYRGSKTMSREELIVKISETVLVSGMLVFWDAIDPLIETQLTAFVGPFAPYLAASLTAIGFGVSSYCLRKVIPAAVAYIVNLKTGWHDALDAARDAVDKLMVVGHQEMILMGVAREYNESTQGFVMATIGSTAVLQEHTSIKRLDMRSLVALPSDEPEAQP